MLGIIGSGTFDAGTGIVALRKVEREGMLWLGTLPNEVLTTRR